MIKVNMNHVKMEGVGIILMAEAGLAVQSVAELIRKEGQGDRLIWVFKSMIDDTIDDVLNTAIDDARENAQEEPEIKNAKRELAKALLKSLFEGKQDDEPCDGWKFNVKEAGDGTSE